jgi:hypothetical protein
MHESAESTAQNLHESRTEGARKVMEETIACSDYPGHQSQHRHTDRGWVCPVCTPPVH